MTSAASSITSEDSQEAIRGMLEPGEQLLWSGRPRQGFMLRASDGLAIPFSLAFGAFAVFWEWTVLHMKAPGFFALWGIPFVAVGFYLVFGRFIVDAYQRSRTYYAVTDRRALIITEMFRRNIRTLGLEGLTDMNLKEGASGRGTIIFGRDEVWGTLNGFMVLGFAGSASRAPAFEGIPDAQEVLNLIRSAQRKLGNRA